MAGQTAAQDSAVQPAARTKYKYPATVASTGDMGAIEGWLRRSGPEPVRPEHIRWMRHQLCESTREFGKRRSDIELLSRRILLE